MDESLVFFFVCFLPIVMTGGLIALIIWAMRSGRIKQLQAQLAGLEANYIKLQSRVFQLEGWATNVQGAIDQGAFPKVRVAPEYEEEAPEDEEEAEEDEHVPVFVPPDAHAFDPQTSDPQSQDPAPDTPSADARTADAPTEATPVAEAQPQEPVVHPHVSGKQGSLLDAWDAQQPQPQAPQGPPQDPPREPPAPPPHDPEPEKPAIDWEQWIGVRGAAALGGLALTVAAVYFFKYSIETGLIGETARVIIGIVLGVGCIFAAEVPLRERYRVLGDWLAGAGGAILYLSFWASSALYHLVPTGVAFGGMIVVTIACCVLAVRRRAAPVAVLGLLGGFATPALLSTGQDRPIELFTYLALLNGGLIMTARARKWSFLPAVSLAVTTLYQLYWIGGRMGMGGDRLAIGMGIAAVFPVLYLVFARPKAGDDETATWKFTRVVAALFPFVFSLFFALQAPIGPALWPVGLLLAALCAGTCWMSERDELPWMPIAGAASSVAVIGAWVLANTITVALAWELAGVLALVLVPLHFFAERNPSDEQRDIHFAGGLFAFGSMLLMLAASAVRPVPVWAAVASWSFSAIALIRQTKLGLTVWARIAAPVMFAIGLSTVHLAGGTSVGFPSEAFFLGAYMLIGAALQWPALGKVREQHIAFSNHGVAAFACIALLHLTSFEMAGLTGAMAPITPLLAFGALAIFALLGLMPSVRLGDSRWLAATMVCAAVSTIAFVGGGAAVENVSVTLGGVLGLLLLFAASPLLLPTMRDRAGIWRTAAMAPIVFFPAYFMTYREAFGSSSDGLAALSFGVVSLGVAFASKRIGPPDESARRTAFVWPAVAAMGFITAAIPMQLNNEWVTIAWAVQGLAVLMLWRRVDHPGLKWLSLALFAAVTVRLTVNPAVLSYHPPSGIPVFNWLAYTYLVPVVAFVLGSRILDRFDRERRRSWESEVLGESNLLTGAVAMAAIIIGFVWVNLTIVDAFSTGRALELPFDRVPARDLTLSISWALYGIGLLVLGIWRVIRPLRALGTTLIAITALKVFLYDLGNLEDLWRVASLVGLALSLIAVSFIYRRFVFAGDKE